MMKRVGSAHLPGGANLPEKELRYYVQGDRKTGYSIRIVALQVTGEACGATDKNLRKTLHIARKIAKGEVFPENLGEILEDFKIDNDSH